MAYANIASKSLLTAVVGTDNFPSWYNLKVPYLKLTDLSKLPRAKLTVATFWTTIEPAIKNASGKVVHYCQGYEGFLPHNKKLLDKIEGAYNYRVAKWVTTPFLKDFIEKRFKVPAFVLPPTVENFFRPLPKVKPTIYPKIAIVGSKKAYTKGVETALEAFRFISLSKRVRLVRISNWPFTDEEKVENGKYYYNITPKKVAEVIRRADLLLAPYWWIEGFGLPILEALASGIPSVVSDIPSLRYLANYLPKANPHDSNTFAAKGLQLLSCQRKWLYLKIMGIVTSLKYRELWSSKRLLTAYRWALNI